MCDSWWKSTKHTPKKGFRFTSEIFCLHVKSLVKLFKFLTVHSFDFLQAPYWLDNTFWITNCWYLSEVTYQTKQNKKRRRKNPTKQMNKIELWYLFECCHPFIRPKFNLYTFVVFVLNNRNFFWKLSSWDDTKFNVLLK